MQKLSFGRKVLSVFLTILVLLDGIVFLNITAVRNSLSRDAVHTAIEEVNLPERIQNALSNDAVFSQITQEQWENVLNSSGIQTLVDQYGDYISDYLLYQDESNAITAQSVKTALQPMLEELLDGVSFLSDSMKQTIIDSIPYESIAEVFPSASSQLPEEATQFMSTLASQTVWVLCLVLLAVFVLALVFSAGPKRILTYLGTGVLLCGGFSLAIGKFAILFMDGMSSNPVFPIVLNLYDQQISLLSFITMVSGVVMLIVGIILWMIFGSRKQSYYTFR